MLCSRCSHVVKPVVAIDIDGTLGDYHGHFINFAAAYFGLAPTPAVYGGDEPFKEWYIDRVGITEDEWYDVKLAYRQGGMKRSMPLISGASELLMGMYQNDAEVWLTTTRPYLRLDNVDPDTRFWLGLHSLPFDHMIYDERKYSQLAGLVDSRRVVAVLDDLQEQYSHAVQVFGPEVPLLAAGKYNTRVAVDNVADDLYQARTLIAARISNWRDQYASSN